MHMHMDVKYTHYIFLLLTKENNNHYCAKCLPTDLPSIYKIYKLCTRFHIASVVFQIWFFFPYTTMLKFFIPVCRLVKHIFLESLYEVLYLDVIHMSDKVLEMIFMGNSLVYLQCQIFYLGSQTCKNIF